MGTGSGRAGGRGPPDGVFPRILGRLAADGVAPAGATPSLNGHEDRDSLGGELEHDLAAAVAARAEAEESAEAATRHAGRLDEQIGQLRAELARTAAERDEYRSDLEAVFATKLGRHAEMPREIHGRRTRRR